MSQEVASVAPKGLAKRSEAWLSLVTMVGVFASAMVGNNSTAMMSVSVAVLALTVGVFAIFKTDLPSVKPGIKTKAFWSSVVTVVGSIALALSEADIAGLPSGVTKLASILSALVAAGGYTVIRYRAKVG